MMQLTIVGFGNQAKAWAQNLQDSHFPVNIALRASSPSHVHAQKLQLKTLQIENLEFENIEALALLTPDDSHADFLKLHAHKLKPGTLILYAHGFSLEKNRFEKLYPHLTHILFAPKSIGSELRKQYEMKGKLGAVYSLEHVRNNLTEIESWIFCLARSLGINMGPYIASFKHETQADLYSEQGLLCSLIPYTAGEMFKHLVEKGIEPELAYFECWHELKLIVNAMVDIGPEGFYDLISPNALIGSEKGFKQLMTSDFKHNLSSLLTDIQNNKFNHEIEEENVDALRAKIKNRWKESALMKTFNEIKAANP